jgi:hypothetical protein
VLEVAVDPKQRAHQQAKPAQGGGFVSVRPRLAS